MGEKIESIVKIGTVPYVVRHGSYREEDTSTVGSTGNLTYGTYPFFIITICSIGREWEK